MEEEVEEEEEEEEGDKRYAEEGGRVVKYNKYFCKYNYSSLNF